MSTPDPPPRRVAIYGGSFNPPHVSHVLAAAYVLATEPLDELLVMPCAVHPFAKDLVAFEHRYRMCLDAFGWIPKVSVSTLEHELGGESRTLRTLEALRERHPHWAMRLVIGADILHDAPKWYGFERVVELAPLLVLGRVGIEHVRAPEPVLPGLSSSSIRSALARGGDASLAHSVPWQVLEYIRANHLYHGHPAHEAPP